MGYNYSFVFYGVIKHYGRFVKFKLMLLTLLCAFMKYPCDYKLNVFQVSGILSVALAALYPLTLNEIYYSVNSLNVHTFVPWEEFLQRFRVSSDHHQSFQLFFFFFYSYG